MEMFEPVARKILTHIDSWVGISGTVTTWVTGPILMGVTIMVMWHGFNVMRGAGGSSHFLDVFAKTLRAFLVMSLALAGGAYTTNVVGFINELRTDLANLFVTSPAGSSSYAALDASIEQAVNTMRSGMPWVADNTNVLIGNFTGLIGLVAMSFMVGCLVVYALIAAVNLLLIDFAMAIIFALGPLFVACFAFESLARFFDAWLGAALKYTFTAVVIVAIISIGNGILAQYCAQIAQEGFERIDFIGTSFAALGATGILIMIALRAPEIAGNIVGGIGISAMGPQAAAAPLATISAAGKAAGRGSANLAAYGAGAAASSAPGQAVAGAVSNVISTASQSSLGQRAISASQHVRSAGAAASNMSPGSVGAAYASGAGRAAGTGTITGGRPIPRPIRADWKD